MHVSPAVPGLLLQSACELQDPCLGGTVGAVVGSGQAISPCEHQQKSFWCLGGTVCAAIRAKVILVPWWHCIRCNQSKSHFGALVALYALQSEQKLFWCLGGTECAAIRGGQAGHQPLRASKVMVVTFSIMGFIMTLKTIS